VAALFDIHGNLPALDAVLEEVRRAGVDAVVIGGDVFPGPMPLEVLSRLADLDERVSFIKGNGERLVLASKSGDDISEVPPAYRDVVHWGASILGDDAAEKIAAWPATLRVQVDVLGDVFFCHATPRNDTEIFTRRTAEDRLLPVFRDVGALAVCGHTHMQFDRTVGTTRVVNAGSVGMPFGEPGAYWLLLGPGIELRRTAYDLNLAAERIRATRYPKAEEFAAVSVLRPPTEDEMLAAYSRVELRWLSSGETPPANPSSA
jgi:predicted phosphodiesterase